MFSALFLLAFLSCSSTPVTLAQNCDVRLSSLTPDTVQAGGTVRAQGGPMTAVWDTAVYVDDTRAEVIALNRVGCEECDTCKEQNNCKACDDCDDCDAICTADCIESIDFVAPNFSSIETSVSFYNGHGQSNLIGLTFGDRMDTGTTNDSGEMSTPIDTASPEDTSSP